MANIAQVSVFVLLRLVPSVLAGSDHAGHGSGGKDWEYAGVFALTGAETYTWTAAKGNNDKYADNMMKMLIVHIAEDRLEDMEKKVEQLWDAATFPHTDYGAHINMPQNKASLAICLGFDPKSWLSMFYLKVATSGKWAIYTQHMPNKFENGFHYLKNSHGDDIEAVTEAGGSAPAPTTAPKGNENDLDTCKWISAFMLLAIVYGSAFFLKPIAKLNPLVLEFINAVAGGVLLALACVHMIHCNVALLTPWGKDIGKAFSRDDAAQPAAGAGGADPHAGHAGHHRLLRGFDSIGGRLLQGHEGHNRGSEFPLGYWAFIAGFFFMVWLEKVLDDGRGHHCHPQKSGALEARECAVGSVGDCCNAKGDAADAQESPEVVQAEGPNGVDDVKVAVAEPSGEDAKGDGSKTKPIHVNFSKVRSFNTLLAVSFHCFVEAFAVGTVTGGSKSESAYMLTTISVALHKPFCVVAIFTPFLPIYGVIQWWSLVSLFAFNAPIALLLGMLTSENIEAKSTALLQCFAAGTLIAIGINHMLMPAIGEGTTWKLTKVAVSFLSFTFLALLPVITG